MPSLGTLKARILNDPTRPSLTAEVAAAVTEAIAFSATTRFWFNEVLDETITTVAATASYPIPANLRRLLRAEVTISGQRNQLCGTMGWDEYRDLTASGANTGQTTDLCFYGANLYPYPIPNDAWTLSLSYCSSLGDLANDAASNAWTTEAEPLIRARAKYDILVNVIRDMTGEADRAQVVEHEWLARLLQRGAGHGKPARVAPSGW